MSAPVPGLAQHAAARASLEAEDAADRFLFAPALLLRLSARRLVALDTDLAEQAARLAVEVAWIRDAPGSTP